MFCCYNSMTVLKAAHFKALYFMFTVNLEINNLKLPGKTEVCVWYSLDVSLCIPNCHRMSREYSVHCPVCTRVRVCC